MFFIQDINLEIDIEYTEEPNEIIERFMYYAFGMQWEGAWMYDEPVDSEENRYRYNGKECYPELPIINQNKSLRYI